MTGPCQAPVDGGQFARGMLGFIDCHALSIGETGYRALAAPHSSLSLVVTSLFTILIALIGYRLLLGGQVRLRDGVLTIAKVGVVLALTTGWSGYRTLFFDVALRGPAELVAEIGSPMQLPGAGGGLADRLQSVDDGFAALLTLDAERNVLAVAQPMQTPNSGLFAPASTATATPSPRIAPLPPVDIVSLRSARQFVLVAALGSFAATRLLAGILLAIGPFFIAFLLFDATRGLFVGWLRVLGGAALGAFGASLVVGVGIAYFEPVLANLIAQRTAGTPMSDGEAMLLPASLIFALTTLAILIGMARVAAGLHWPVSAAPVLIDTPTEPSPPRLVTAGSAGNIFGQPASAERSRALAVADAVAGQVHRERSATIDGATNPRAGPMARTADDPGIHQVPLGQTFRRQPRGRISAGMNRRNAS